MRYFKILLTFMLLNYITPVFGDYVMMCTYFYDPIARIYSVDESGVIAHDYNIDISVNTYSNVKESRNMVHNGNIEIDGIEASPYSIVFSPNGKWGMIGCDSILHNPKTLITTVIEMDSQKKISVLGSAFNDTYYLTAISPDSKYGVYGADLKTLRYDGNSTFTVIPTDNQGVCDVHGAFSSLNGYFYTEDGYRHIDEYKIAEDETMKPTGFQLDISPSSPNQDFMVTPDGKTLLAISIGDYEINSLRVNKTGGCKLVQQFNTESPNAQEVVITPDSKYAILSFWSSDSVPDLRCFKINEDSTLTETGTAFLPHQPGEDLAITPDGKYVVTRALVNNFSYFYVVRVHENGALEYLPDKNFTDTGHVSAMAFVPEPQPTAWGLY